MEKHENQCHSIESTTSPRTHRPMKSIKFHNLALQRHLDWADQVEVILINSPGVVCWSTKNLSKIQNGQLPVERLFCSMIHMPKKFCSSRWNILQGLFFKNIVGGAEPFCDTNSWQFSHMTCASFHEFSKMLKGVRVCYWVDMPCPSPNKTSNQKVYQFKHEWKVMWVSEHPKGVKSNMTDCWDKCL